MWSGISGQKAIGEVKGNAPLLDLSTLVDEERNHKLHSRDMAWREIVLSMAALPI
jgi:hypothetical protein